jgi:HK97 family phage major capsid protein
MGLREDRAFLVGNPPIDAGSPKGMRYYAIAANVNASAGTSLANFQADITTAIANVQKNNVPATPDNSFLIMSPSTFWKMYSLATTTGDMIFAAMLSGAQPRMFGFPVKITTQLETSNAWIGANAGMIIFAHGPSMEIHDSMARTIATYVGGAYYDPVLAAVASGISNDETVITCIAEHDFFQKYDTASSFITGYAT